LHTRIWVDYSDLNLYYISVDYKTVVVMQVTSGLLPALTWEAHVKSDAMSVIYAHSHSSFLYSVTYNSTQKNCCSLLYREMLNRCLKKGLKDIDSWSSSSDSWATQR
jgi:hypothetical protein